jgi:hypothetical protein
VRLVKGTMEEKEKQNLVVMKVVLKDLSQVLMEKETMVVMILMEEVEMD